MGVPDFLSDILIHRGIGEQGNLALGKMLLDQLRELTKDAGLHVNRIAPQLVSYPDGL
jgi:hypothetical protein